MDAIVFGLWIAGMLIVFKWMIDGGVASIIFLMALGGIFLLDILSGWPPSGSLLWWLSIGAIFFSIRLLWEPLSARCEKRDARQRQLQNESPKRYSEAELKAAVDRTVENYRANQSRDQSEENMATESRVVPANEKENTNAEVWAVIAEAVKKYRPN